MNMMGNIHFIIPSCLVMMVVVRAEGDIDNCLKKCGHGGLCLEGVDVTSSCFCDVVSPDTYLMNRTEMPASCRLPKDHCASDPCAHGAPCVSTFGGYFCECDAIGGNVTRYGKSCEHSTSTGSRLDIAQGVYVYYRSLPVVNKSREMFISILKPGEDFKLALKIPDDRRESEYYVEDLVYLDVNSMCKACRYSDRNACHYIKEGLMRTARFVVSKTSYVRDKRDVQMGKISGRLKEIIVEVYNGQELSFRETYNLLVDLDPSAMDCLPRIRIDGCSMIKTNPTKINMCKPPKIAIMPTTQDCKFMKTKAEVMFKGSDYLQRRYDSISENIEIPKDLKYEKVYELQAFYYKIGGPPYLQYQELIADTAKCWVVLEPCIEEMQSEQRSLIITGISLFWKISKILVARTLGMNEKDYDDSPLANLIKYLANLKGSLKTKDVTVEETIFRVVQQLHNAELPKESIRNVSIDLLATIDALLKKHNEFRVNTSDVSLSQNELESDMKEEEERSVRIKDHVNKVLLGIVQNLDLYEETSFVSENFRLYASLNTASNFTNKTVQLPDDTGTSLSISPTNLPPTKVLKVGLAKFENSLFNWSETRTNSPLLQIFMIVDNEFVEDIPSKVTLQVTPNNIEIFGIVKGLRYPNISETNELVDIQKFFISDTEPVWGLIHFKFINFTSPIKVKCFGDEFPEYNTINSTGITINDTKKDFHFDATSYDYNSIIYLGVIAEGNVTSVNYSFIMNNGQCLIWGKGNWLDATCKIEHDSTNGRVSCSCNHSSIFSVAMFTPPYTVNPISDIYLFRNFLDNPYVAIIVITFLLILIILLFWGRYKDNKENKQKTVELLADCPTGDYPYLIGVYTGTYLTSGTTADVCIKIIGASSKSMVHNLKSQKMKALQVGQDDWFLIYSDSDLGKINSIEIFHNDAGSSSDWFCKKIVIYDVKKDETYLFEVLEWISVLHVNRDGRLYNIYYCKKDKSDEKDEAKIIGHLTTGFRTSHVSSIFIRHPRSLLSRCQLIITGSALLFFAMLLSMMFYGALDQKPEDMPAVEITGADYIIGVESFLIAFPVTFIILFLFEKPMRMRVKEEYKEIRKQKEEQQKSGFISKVHDMVSDHFTSEIEAFPLLPITVARRKFYSNLHLVWLSVAWTVSVVTILTCAFFMILYSLKFGRNKSIRWIITFFIGWVQDLLLFHPITIVVTAIILGIIFSKASSVDQVNCVIFRLKKSKLKKSQALDMRTVNRIYTPLHIEQVNTRRMIREKREFKRWFYCCFLTTLILFIMIVCVVTQRDEYRHQEVNYFIDEITNPIGSKGMESVHNRDSLIEFLKESIPKYCSLTRDPEEVQTKDKSELSHHFKGIFNGAEATLWYFTEDTDKYTYGWRKYDYLKSRESWKYSSYYKLATTSTFGYTLLLYDGGGYTYDLGNTYEESRDILFKLERYNWIDKYTRTVFLEYNLYNPNTNSFIIVTMLAEQFSEGIYTMTLKVELDNFKQSKTGIGIFFVIEWCLIVVFFTIMLTNVMSLISQIGIANAFKHQGVFIDVLCCACGAVTISTCITRVLYFSLFLDKYFSQTEEFFVSFTYPIYETILFHCALGLFAVTLGLKLISILSDSFTIMHFRGLLFLKIGTMISLFIFLFYINSFFNLMTQYFGCPSYPGLIAIIFDRNNMTRILFESLVLAEVYITAIYGFVFFFTRYLFVAIIISYYQDAVDYLADNWDPHKYQLKKYLLSMFPFKKKKEPSFNLFDDFQNVPDKLATIHKKRLENTKGPKRELHEYFVEIDQILTERKKHLEDMNKKLDKALKLLN